MVQVSLFVANSGSTLGHVYRFDFTPPTQPGRWYENFDGFGTPTLIARDFVTAPGKGVLDDFRFAAPGGLAYLPNGQLYIATGGDTRSSPIKVIPGIVLAAAPIVVPIAKGTFRCKAISKTRELSKIQSEG